MHNFDRVGFITGTSKGIGRYLAESYCDSGVLIFGCSRTASEWSHPNFIPLLGDVSSEADVRSMMQTIRQKGGRLDFVLNNAGIASMNHSLLVPTATVQKVFNTNFLGTYLVCREGARLLQKSALGGRIVNFSTVAVPLNLDGEAIYAASKSAVETLTRIMAKELSSMKVTVNAVGPTPIKTDLIKGVPENKIEKLLEKQAIKRMGEFSDVKNVVDFYLQKSSDFITGQIVYLGGVF